MSELEWLKQDWMKASMDKQKFIDNVVNSYNKHRANKITETKVLDNGRVVQFSNDICSVQVFLISQLILLLSPINTILVGI